MVPELYQLFIDSLYARGVYDAFEWIKEWLEGRPPHPQCDPCRQRCSHERNCEYRYGSHNSCNCHYGSCDCGYDQDTEYPPEDDCYDSARR